MNISDPDEIREEWVVIHYPAGGNLNDLPPGSMEITTFPFNPGDHHLPGRKVLRKIRKSKFFKVSERERNPYDEPPGKGYNYKILNGEYIEPKPYSVERWSDRDAEKVFSIPRPNGLPGKREIANAFPVDLIRHNRSWTNVAGSEARIEQHAIRNLYASMRKHQQHNLGVLLVELRESVGLIGNAAITVYQVIKSLRRGRVSDAMRSISSYFGENRETYLPNRDVLNRRRRRQGFRPISKADYASNMWLELQFGWLPILSDIQKTIRLVTDKINSSDRKILVFHGYANGTVSQELALDTTMPFARWSGSARRDVKVRHSCTAHFEIVDPEEYFLHVIGLSDPRSIAWEAVPFSFVVDWFIPVGHWLDSLNGNLGLKLLDYSYSKKRSYEMDAEIRSIQDADMWGVFRPKSSYSQFQRIVSPHGLPDYPLSVTWNDLLSPWKIATAGALIHQLFGRN